MKKLFISYELAEQLKIKGFNEPCIAFYSIEKKELLTVHQFSNFEFNFGTNDDNKFLTIKVVACPLYQQVIDWFREKHNMHINPMSIINFEEDEYRVEIEWDKGKKSYITKTYNNYYEPLNNAIQKAINILKN